MERCEVCGFDYEAVPVDAVAARASAAAQAVAAALRGASSRATRRPHPDRWSMVEYASHVRDVLLTMRDRIVIGLVEDDPDFKPLYRDERLALGLYAHDTAEAIAVEVVAAAAMFGRLFAAVDPAGHGRPVRFGFPDPVRRSVGWMGVHGMHEAEHHLGDVRANAVLLDG